MKIDIDSRGFALSLDILLALIPLTIILGIVAADMGNIMYQMEDTIFRGSTERVAADTMNTLLRTSGTPVDWETTGNPSVVGLAKYNTATGTPSESLLSPTKLGALNSSHLQALVGNNSFYLNVTTVDGNLPIKTVTSSSTGLPSNATDIVRVERIARCSQFEIVSSLEGEIRYTGASRQYQPPNFLTSYKYNQTYDYYIFIKNSGFNSVSVVINSFPTITLNSLNSSNSYKINSSYLNVNPSSPNTFYNNSVILNATGTFGSSMDFFIVQTPKNLNASDINSQTVPTRNFRFVLYVWPT
ncbi:hypothetical protein [uncultured Methanobacterium sp.]|uniref:hypothetical protein n=1 Tax=uncultured Methanobacterium sp. TaxID=176306 RepID=UPI002AA60328|nr:hypothetical protein [uncultured Methanobacterium sp.]